jgi:hypothetical protein
MVPGSMLDRMGRWNVPPQPIKQQPSTTSRWTILTASVGSGAAIAAAATKGPTRVKWLAASAACAVAAAVANVAKPKDTK